MVGLFSARLTASSQVRPSAGRFRAPCQTGGFRPAETFVRVLAIFLRCWHDTLPQHGVSLSSLPNDHGTMGPPTQADFPIPACVGGTTVNGRADRDHSVPAEGSPPVPPILLHGRRTGNTAKIAEASATFTRTSRYFVPQFGQSKGVVRSCPMISICRESSCPNRAECQPSGQQFCGNQFRLVKFRIG